MNSEIVRRIMVPLDFSPLSLQALDSAVTLAIRHQADLLLVQILEKNRLYSSKEEKNETETDHTELFGVIKDNLQRHADTLAIEYGIEVQSIVQLGNPSEEICTIAEVLMMDLIVMGSHGLTDSGELCIGTTAYRVGNHASCPVLTIPRNSPELNLNKILIPVRPIPHSLDNFEVVKSLLTTEFSHIIILGVNKKDDHLRAYLRMEKIAESLGEKTGVKEISQVISTYYSDDLVQQIMRVAEYEKPDLLVISATMKSYWSDHQIDADHFASIDHRSFPILTLRRSGNERTNDESNTSLQELIRTRIRFIENIHING